MTFYSRMTLEVLKAGLFPGQKFSEMKGKKREKNELRRLKTALPQGRRGEGRLEAMWQAAFVLGEAEVGLCTLGGSCLCLGSSSWPF